MSEERPAPIKSLKDGSYIIADGEACKVVNITLSKPGKHGSKKARIEAMGLLDGKRHFILKPADDTVLVPIIDKKKAQIISINGDIAQLMDLENYETFEVSIPAELKDKIEAGKEVLYWIIMDKKVLKEVH